MHHSTMFAIGGILCVLFALYSGVLTYLFRNSTLSEVAYAVLCVVSLTIGIATILRAWSHKKAEKTKLK